MKNALVNNFVNNFFSQEPIKTIWGSTEGCISGLHLLSTSSNLRRIRFVTKSLECVSFSRLYNSPVHNLPMYTANFFAGSSVVLT